MHPPAHRFCVSAGIIVVSSEPLGSAGMIGVSKVRLATETHGARRLAEKSSDGTFRLWSAEGEEHRYEKRGGHCHSGLRWLLPERREASEADG